MRYTVVCCLVALASLAIGEARVTAIFSQKVGTPVVSDACGEVSAEPGTPGAELLGGAAGTPGVIAAEIPFDLVALDLLAAQSAGAAALAEVAVDRAEHQELRAFAQTAVETAAMERATLREWRETWYPDTPVLPVNRLIGELDRLKALLGLAADGGRPVEFDPATLAAALCAAPAPVDLAIVDTLIARYEATRQIAAITTYLARRSELASFATEIDTARERDIGQLLVWREVWFAGAATPVPGGGAGM